MEKARSTSRTRIVTYEGAIRVPAREAVRRPFKDILTQARIEGTRKFSARPGTTAPREGKKNANE